MNPDSLTLAYQSAATMQRLALFVLLAVCLAMLAAVLWRQRRLAAGAGLTEQERRALEALAKSPVVLWTADCAGTVETIRLSVGGGLTAIGFSPGQLVGTSLEDFHAADPDAEALAIARRVMDTQQGKTCVTSYTVPATGETRHYLTAFVPTADGAVVGLAATVIDVTGLVENAEHAREEVVTLRRRLDRVDTRARAAEQEAEALRLRERARLGVAAALDPATPLALAAALALATPLAP